MTYALWGEMLTTAITGESASQRVFGMPFYDYLAHNTAVGSLFDRVMANAGWARYRFRPAVAAYDFGRFRSIVDVGGGTGALMTEILNAYPRPLGVVFDVPRLAEGARQRIEAAGLGERCRFVGGDAFEAVPADADAYVLSNFVINWADEQAVIPLQQCRRAIPADGKLLLVEWIMPAGDDPKEGFRFWDTVTTDLIMLTVFGSRGGHVRTRSQFDALLRAAGFAVAAVVPTHSSVYVIEAVPVA
jgi:SAM-dependent methyltransferase